MGERLPNEQFLLHPVPGTAAARARACGVDLHRTVENLLLSPEERIVRLDWIRNMAKEVGDETELDRSTRDSRTFLELEAILEWKRSLKRI